MASGLTTTYLFPYPLQTDPVDVANDVEDLAVAIESQLLLKAPSLSPSFSGTPTAPTASSDTSTTQIATTQFVINQDYLKSSVASTTYATKNSPTLTGVPLAPTASLGTNTTQIATTEFVANALSNFVTLPSQSGAAGRFLTTNGTSASWQSIQQSDIAGLSEVITGLPGTYSPLNIPIISLPFSYTLLIEDSGRMIELSGGGSLTIPPESSVNFPVGTQVIVVQTGTSQVTIAPGSGVTVNGTPGLKLRSQWSSATIVKRSSNTWIALGDLVA